MDNAKDALNSSLLVDSSYLALKKAVNTPSIFRVLKNASYEIRHSDFLAWLLNPTETHHQGSLFFRALIEDLEIERFGSLDTLQVRRELENLDLFLFNQCSGIVIENKTLSKDGPGQLSHYRQKVRVDERFKHLQVTFVYLTLDGQKPTDRDEVEYWRPYSYERLVSVIEGCLEKVRSEKVTTYVSDYIEALKLDHLQNSEYAKTARSLLKEYSEEFNQNSDQTCQDSRTFEYIRRKKAYVRGVGFFSSENPFAELFESACRRRNYTVSVRGKKQSTYFSFLPPMPTTLLRALDYSGIHQTQLSGLVSSLVSFTFRFLHDKDLLVLSFALGPPNNENKELREKIYLCRKAIWKLNIGHPVERAGRIHTGIYRKNFRFDTSNWSGSLSLSEGVEDLFESKVSPFVDKIYLAIEGCLLNPSDGGET